MLISFIIPCRKIRYLKRFLSSLKKNTHDKSQIEVIVKLDDDKNEFNKFKVENEKKWGFKIKFIITPRLEGQPSLWLADEQMFRLTNANSYFVQLLSDEPYIKTHHWDKKLAKYKKYYSDDIFRIRLSKIKYFNYQNEFDCVSKPDSYPIFTRKWLEVSLGMGDSWASDAYHQLISFYLSMGPMNYRNFFKHGSLNRDIITEDIQYGGLNWGEGITNEMQEYMSSYINSEWSRLCSNKNLNNIAYKATRLYLYILAKSLNFKNFKIIKTSENTCALFKNKNQYLEIYFKLPFVKSKIFEYHVKFKLYSIHRILTSIGSMFSKRIYIYNSRGKNIKILLKKAKKNKFFFLKSYIPLNYNIKKNTFLTDAYLYYFAVKSNLLKIITKNISFNKKGYNYFFQPPGVQFKGIKKNIEIPKGITKINRNDIEWYNNSYKKLIKQIRESEIKVYR